jgi:hypothetical protein
MKSNKLGGFLVSVWRAVPGRGCRAQHLVQANLLELLLQYLHLHGNVKAR